MRRVAAIVLPLTALVAALLGAAPAEAGNVEPIGWRPWPSAPCATGAMTVQSSPGRFVWAAGWIEPCPGTPASVGSRYAIVYFGPAGGVAGRPMSYADPVERTWFEGQLNTKRPDSVPLAACLAYSPTGLLACVSIDVGDDPDVLVVTPIPTDHPRVAWPVYPLMRVGGHGNGYCGTCL